MNNALRDQIKKNINAIQDRIKLYANKYDRPQPLLLAVSKKQSIEKIHYAHMAGLNEFAESYLQEALEKIRALPEIPCWHFIGQLQSNKLKDIATHFNWVHTLTNTKHAKKLNEYARLHDKVINICIQVNIDKDENKGGIAPDGDALQHLALFVLQHCPALKLRGLMCILAKNESYAHQYQSFCSLNKLKGLVEETCHYKLDTLSIGMSQDLEAAIAAGSSVLRVGSAIFGKRI